MKTLSLAEALLDLRRQCRDTRGLVGLRSDCMEVVLDRIDALEAAIEEAADDLQRVMRAAEMSSEIMRDPKRTGNWAGARGTAAAFDRIGMDAASAKAKVRAALSQPADRA